MPDVETIKSFNTGLVEEFRADGGKVGGTYKGANLLLLTTTGAKTRKPRVTPLAYFRFDGKLIIIGSSWGAQAHPAWVRNLWANPSVHVEVGTESFDATARELPAAEREPVGSGRRHGAGLRRIPMQDRSRHPTVRVAAAPGMTEQRPDDAAR